MYDTQNMYAYVMPVSSRISYLYEKLRGRKRRGADVLVAASQPDTAHADAACAP
jgi:hypothetical protein